MDVKIIQKSPELPVCLQIVVQMYFLASESSRNLDDIFTIDNPAFAEHIPDIYPAEL